MATIKKLVNIALQHLFGILLYLSSFFIKEKKGYITIIPNKARFSDNTKYFFLYLKKNKKAKRVFFFTDNKEAKRKIHDKDYRIIDSKFKLFFCLLKSKVIVSDAPLVIFHYLKKFKVSLWHGAPIKKIQLMLPLKTNLIDGSIAKIDVFVSTSDFFVSKIFSKAFNVKKFISAGYPRNDVFFRKIDEYDLINTDKSIIRKVKLKRRDNKIIVYMPTFRDTGGDALKDKIINIKDLNNFAKKNNLIFIFKFHPHPNDNYSLKWSNIWWYPPNKDIYPLLPITDMLITDYSSVAFDYLLLKKPIIFFPYDFHKYVTKDRALVFDYKKMSPGPICYNQTELKSAILNMLKKDIYKKERENLLKLSFKHVDGKASERVYEALKGKLMINLNKA